MTADDTESETDDDSGPVERGGGPPSDTTPGSGNGPADDDSDDEDEDESGNGNGDNGNGSGPR